MATRFYELYSTGDIDGVLDLVGDDYLSHGFGGGGCDLFRVRGGKIVEGWWLGDSGTLLRQIGAIPIPAAS